MLPDVTTKDGQRHWFNDDKSARYKATKFLAWLTHSRIRPPVWWSTVSLHNESDKMENNEIRALGEHKVVTWGIWAVEAYTPADLTSLLEALDSLTISKSSIISQSSASDWLRMHRGSTGSSMELWFANSDDRVAAHSYIIGLPDFAESASGKISIATISIILITMFFVLKQTERDRIDKILHSEVCSKIEPIGLNGVTLNPPEFQRRRLINDVRSIWIAQASNWFREHFPGTFCHQSQKVATYELTTVDGVIPFPKKSRTSNRRDTSILRGLSMDFASTLYELEGDTSRVLCFAAAEERNELGEWHGLFAMTKIAFESQNVVGYGEKIEHYLHKFDQYFRPLMSAYTLLNVLALYRKSVLEIRYLLPDVISRRKAGSAIAQVRRDTARCADAVAIARDMENSLRVTLSIVGDCGLVERPWQESITPEKVRTVLERMLRFDCAGLIRDVPELNLTLQAQASLLNAHASLRLQPYIIFLAVISALASVAGAAAAIKALLR